MKPGPLAPAETVQEKRSLTTPLRIERIVRDVRRQVENCFRTAHAKLLAAEMHEAWYCTDCKQEVSSESVVWEELDKSYTHTACDNPAVRALKAFIFPDVGN